MKSNVRLVIKVLLLISIGLNVFQGITIHNKQEGMNHTKVMIIKDIHMQLEQCLEGLDRVLNEKTKESYYLLKEVQCSLQETASLIEIYKGISQQSIDSSVFPLLISAIKDGVGTGRINPIGESGELSISEKRYLKALREDLAAINEEITPYAADEVICSSQQLNNMLTKYLDKKKYNNLILENEL